MSNSTSVKLIKFKSFKIQNKLEGSIGGIDICIQSKATDCSMFLVGDNKDNVRHPSGQQWETENNAPLGHFQ